MLNSSTIYFQGSPSAAKAFAEDHDLDSMDPDEFQMTFAEWVSQCWMHDSPVPKTSAEIAHFNLDDLVPQFRRAFRDGDWKRMRKGRGVTLDEQLTWLELRARTPFGVVVGNDRHRLDGIDVPVPPGRSCLSISTGGLGVCIAEFLRAARAAGEDSQEPEYVTGSPLPKAKRTGLSVLLFDPQTHSGHVISLRAMSDDMMLIAYDDPTWPGGKSMLSEGENSFGIEAQYLGDDAPGTWMVSSLLLTDIIYAIPLPLNLFEWWKSLDEQFNDELAMMRADNSVDRLLLLSKKRVKSFLGRLPSL